MPTELVMHAVNRGAMVVTAGDERHTVTMDYPAPGAAISITAALRVAQLGAASVTWSRSPRPPLLCRSPAYSIRCLSMEACSSCALCVLQPGGGVIVDQASTLMLP